MPTKDEVIEKMYKRFEEGAQRLYKRIKEMPEYNTMGIRVKDIDDWIKRSHLTVKPKFYYKGKFNSFVAPGPKHTYQVDLFNFKYEQKVNFGPDTPTAGIIAVDVFTKETHIVPIKDHKAPSWRDALSEIIAKMGAPKVIMSDQDASVMGNEGTEWFRRHPGIQHTITRHHAAFAERALRMFKHLMYKKVKKDVRPWPEYLSDVLERMNKGRLPIDPDNRVPGDEKTYPRNTTGFTPEEAAKPENWFEAHTNLELKATHNRKYPEIHIGDHVKVWKQKKALDKENVSDFPDDPVKVKNIIRSLGQTRYIVEGRGTTIPVLRADIWLHKPGERKDTTPLKGVAYKASEPFMSLKRVGIRIREHNKAKREENRVAKAAAKDKAKAEKKETRLKTKEMVMAAKGRGAKARAEAAKKYDEELRESLRTRIARLDWRGRPIYR